MVQKAQNEQVPGTIVVSPTLVVLSRGTVFVNRHWDQNSIMFFLVVIAPVPSSWGSGHQPVGPSVEVTVCVLLLQEAHSMHLENSSSDRP